MKKTIILTLFLGLLILLVMGLFSCTSVKLLDEKKQMTSEKSTSEEPLGKETIREEVISEEVISEEVLNQLTRLL
ncbi:hypothetical protein HYU21_04885 [Candidatus Woesearchaeota archaeon]|nr:hypothetical protein [Candidatus Woesearchaeota archaeon]